MSKSCPGCVGRGTGTECCICGEPVPAALRRTTNSTDEWSADCPACVSGKRHTHT
jgi:hypothetical protein